MARRSYSTGESPRSWVNRKGPLVLAKPRTSAWPRPVRTPRLRRARSSERPRTWPESASGLTALIDQRSDVYLLGATLYEILTGQRPRTAKTALEMVKMAEHEPPIPAGWLKTEVPRALGAICPRRWHIARKTATQLRTTSRTIFSDLSQASPFRPARVIAGTGVALGQAAPQGLVADGGGGARRRRRDPGIRQAS